MSNPVYEAVTNTWPLELKGQFPEQRFSFVSETGSTNDDLLARARAGELDDMFVLQADYQSKGRGRRGDQWAASPGSNLLFSIALKLPEDRSVWTRLPHLTAYLVGKATESIFAGEFSIQAKWPNDLLVDGKKLGGILVETVVAPTPMAVVGVGLNVNMKQSDLPEELKPIATSLYDIHGYESSRSFLLGLIVRGFLEHFPADIFEFETVHEWIEERNFLAGKRVKVVTATDELTGIAGKIDSNGALRLELETGEIRKVISSEQIVIC